VSWLEIFHLEPGDGSQNDFGHPDINIYCFEAFRHKSSQIHDELNMAVVFGVLYQAVGGFPGPK